jgi:DNA-binding transcriptional LysR family regulator
MSELRKFDLNLLLAFDLLMQERNVSRAAERMFISQSAMSHVLHRLRQQLDDPLLVRATTGMRPTARALALIGPVRKVLREIEQLIEPSKFDPRLSQRSFVLDTIDYIEYLMVPPLIEHISKQAPGIDIHVRQTEAPLPEAELENGDIDVVIGFEVILKPPTSLVSELLFEDQMACIVRENHPDVGSDISLEEYIDMKHILISRSWKKTGVIDEWLAAQGLERRIALIVPHFLSAPLIVAKTDMVLSLPLRIAEKFVQIAPVKILHVPLDLPSYPVIMVWHPLFDKEAAHCWLREQIAGIGRGISQGQL